MVSFELSKKTKYVFSSYHERGTKKQFWVLTRNRTSDFRFPRSDALPLSHSESVVSKPFIDQLIKLSHQYLELFVVVLFVCLFLFCFFARLFHPLVSCKETIWVATCKFGTCEYWQTNWWTIDWQVKEHAAHALGFLMVGDENFPHHEKLIDGLCEAAKVLLSSCIILITETHNSQHRAYPKWEISSFLTLDQ